MGHLEDGGQGRQLDAHGRRSMFALLWKVSPKRSFATSQRASLPYAPRMAAKSTRWALRNTRSPVWATSWRIGSTSYASRSRYPKHHARRLDQMNTGWGSSNLTGAMFWHLYQLLGAQGRTHGASTAVSRPSTPIQTSSSAATRACAGASPVRACAKPHPHCPAPSPLTATDGPRGRRHASPRPGLEPLVGSATPASGRPACLCG
jgi:hypothetical protein